MERYTNSDGDGGAAAGGGEALSDSAVVPSVYSSAAPQECVNIHNSDHLAMGTTGGLASKTSHHLHPLLPRPPLSHTRTHSLQILF